MLSLPPTINQAAKRLNVGAAVDKFGLSDELRKRRTHVPDR
jgi:hypothetical protein